MVSFCKYQSRKRVKRYWIDMKNKDFIPTSIYDIVAVERLKRLPFESVKEDVPALLEWLQDTHWDVAEGIAKYLVPHVNEIKQELLFILNSNDGMWKYFVMYILIGRVRRINLTRH